MKMFLLCAGKSLLFCSLSDWLSSVPPLFKARFRWASTRIGFVSEEKWILMAHMTGASRGQIAPKISASAAGQLQPGFYVTACEGWRAI